MVSKSPRAVLFWSVCIPVRSVLATQGNRPALRAAAVVIATRWLAGLEDASKGFFGGKAWWADQRPLHGALWGMYAATGNDIWLKADVATAIVNWIRYSF